MTKFTKGPWWAVQDTAGAWQVMTLRDDESRVNAGENHGANICMSIGDHTEGRTRGNERDNANLIAAAPELYEALEDYKALLTLMSGEYPNLQSKLDEAIRISKKARGES